MYFSEAVIENNGPLRWLNITAGFSKDGNPKPIILVGGNGSGKTNFLSLIVDALFEAVSVHYDEVLPAKGLGRAWFRVVGGGTISSGAAGSFSILKFNDNGTIRSYKEKAGNIDPEQARIRVPAGFVADVTWSADGSFKEFQLDNQRSQQIFENGVYAYFPSSRSEKPHWLNREAIAPTQFDDAPAIQKRLTKPIYVEQALESFKQWLMSLLADSRVELVQSKDDGSWMYIGSAEDAQKSSNLLQLCNLLIQEICCDPTLSFYWLGRKSAQKVAIVSNKAFIFCNLDALSTGQAILLGMFGTLLKYADMSQAGLSPDLSMIKGICIIDEIDAHIHIEVQNSVLPRLISLFPNVQFIVSSHSPIFVLGMERKFGPEKIQVIDMPLGIPVGAESYSEFGKALDAMSASHSFTERVVAEAKAGITPVVYVEGETDAPYIKHAARILGKSNLLSLCEIEWIGAKDSRGQGFHTGADALRHTLSVLKANPNLSNRRILLLNDNDSKMPDDTIGDLWVRKLPINPSNTKIKAGIENLLNEKLISEDHYQVKTSYKPNGDVVSTKTLRKAALCEEACKINDAEYFGAFAPVLEIVEDFIANRMIK
ncbi:AAA family ATPase [Sphingomonas hankookensis]|uniref:AAA family ATPase n=1 Tax=Sphingomonas hankookensis TaxID=563996 RepID=UPI001F56CF2D|nr:AAA family ATPase [Sphingomonas hankookensis]